MFHTLPSAEPFVAGRKLVVTIVIEPDGTPLVTACEVQGKAYRNQTTWPQPRRLEDVMQPDMADTLRQCLGKLSGRAQDIALPSLLHDQPGLLLSHAHLSATELDTGALSILLRFKTFLGSLSQVFLPHVDLVSGLHDSTLDIADRIMMDISMPLLNFLSLDEAGGVLSKQDAERMVAHLTDQSHALRFQIELIKRHVARTEMIRRPLTPAYRPAPATPQAALSHGIAAGGSGIVPCDEDTIAYVEAFPETG
jgi:hypothetical protein